MNVVCSLDHPMKPCLGDRIKSAKIRGNGNIEDKNVQQGIKKYNLLLPITICSLQARNKNANEFIILSNLGSQLLGIIPAPFFN